MIKKSWLGIAGITFVAFCAVGASARTSTAINGRTWNPSDDACFTSANYGTVVNSCSAVKTFRVGGHVDSTAPGGNKSAQVTGRGNGTVATGCLVIGANQLGLTASTAWMSTTSSTNTLLFPSASVFVPTDGQLYAHCDVAPGGAIASFTYSP